MENMDLFNEKEEHPVWEIVRKDIYTEEGHRQVEYIYDFLTAMKKSIGSLTMQELWKLWNEFGDETFSILKKLTASESSESPDAKGIVAKISVEDSVVNKLIKLHDEMRKEDCTDTRVMILFDAINRIRSLECEVGALLQQETSRASDFKLNEQIIIDTEDYSEEQFNLLAKVLGCTGAKEQIVIHTLGVKSM